MVRFGGEKEGKDFSDIVLYLILMGRALVGQMNCHQGGWVGWGGASRLRFKRQ